MKLISLTIFVCFTIFSHGIAAELVKNDTKPISFAPLTQTISSADAGVSIRFPADWEIMQKVMETEIIAFAPRRGEDDLFRKNANLIYLILDSEISKENFYSLNLKSLNNQLSDFDLESEELDDIDGVEAKKIIFTHTMGVVNARVIQYLMLVDKNAYVLTFTSDPIEYSKYKQIFDEIARSMQFHRSR